MSNIAEEVENSYYSEILDETKHEDPKNKDKFCCLFIIKLMNLLKKDRSDKIWKIVKNSLILVQNLFLKNDGIDFPN